MKPIWASYMLWATIIQSVNANTFVDDDFFYEDDFVPAGLQTKVLFEDQLFTYENFTELMVKMVDRQNINDGNLSMLRIQFREAEDRQLELEKNCTSLYNETTHQLKELERDIETVKELDSAIRSMTTLSAACFAMFAKLGFSARHVGMVTTKNIKSILLQESLSIAMTCLFWYLIGYGVAWGDDSYPKYFSNGIYGQTNYLGGGITSDVSATMWSEYMLQLAYVMVVTSIPPGATAERATLSINMFVCAAQTCFIYPVVAHLVWHPSGYATANRPRFLLFDCGAIDFGGSAVIHITAGATALAGALFMGPRQGRWVINNHQKIRLQAKSQAEPAYEAIGTFIIFASMVATNGAAPRDFISMITVSGRAMSNSLIAAGSSCLGSILITKYQTGVFSHQIACGGLLAGVVSISAGCAVVDGYQALGIGFGGSLCYYIEGMWMLKLRVDDVSHATAIHLLAGMWGVISTGLFAKTPYIENAYYPRAYDCSGFFISGEVRQLYAQLAMLGLVIAWVGTLATATYILGDKLVGSRYDSFWEKEGVDYHIMGGTQIFTSTSVEPKIKGQVTDVITNKHNKEASKLLRGIQVV